MILIKGIKDEFTVVIPIRIGLEAAIPELLKKRLVPLMGIFAPARAADLAPLVADVDAVEYALPTEFIDKAHTIVFIFISSAVYLLMLLNFFANGAVSDDLICSSQGGSLRSECLAFLTGVSARAINI